MSPGVARRVAAALLLVIFLAAIQLAPPGGLERLAATTPFQAPSFAHPFGTDDLGRDLLAAIAQGTRTSLIVGGSATLISISIGLLVGTIAGLSRPTGDDVIMRAVDATASLPTLLFAILVASLFGGSTQALIAVLGLTRWPVVARLVRAETKRLRQQQFVLAAVALGLGPIAIARRHVLPHAATVANAAIAIQFGGAIVTEAALAFIGLGDPSVTSLGQLAANGFIFVQHAGWIWVIPVATIGLLAALVAVLTDVHRPLS